MFRVVLSIAVCALPLTMSVAQAQSFGPSAPGVEIETPAPLGPPKSITQRYVPHGGLPARGIALLIDENSLAPVATPSGPVIAVTSPAPLPSTASLPHGSPVIVVSNMKGIGRE